MIKLLFCLSAVVSLQAQIVTTVADFAVSDVTGKEVYRPHVSVHPTDGTFIISWGDDRYGTGSAGRLAGIGDIFVGRYSESGSQTLANSKVGDVHFGFFSEFSMYDSSPLLRSNGDILVAYHVDARTTIESIKFDDVYFSAYNSAGQNLIMDKQVNIVGTSGSGYAYQPCLVPFGSNLLFVYRYNLNDLYHIGITTVDGTTGDLSGDAVVIDDATTGSRAVPSVASNGDRTMVVWADSRQDPLGDIYLQKFSGTNASGSNTKVNTDATGNFNQYPRVAMNATGGAVVVWLDTRDHTGGDIYAQLYDGTNAPIGQNFKLTSSTSILWEYPPGVGIDGAGNFIVTWCDSVPGTSWRAKTRAFSATGEPATDILEVTSPVSESIQPDVAVEASGRATYVWVDGRSDRENGTIYAKRVQMTVTAVDVRTEQLPGILKLEQNYPNPFNSSTMIRFEMSEDSHVRIAVYDMLGREISELLSGSIPMGAHSIKWNAAGQPSGVYVCRLSVLHPSGVRRERSVRMLYVR